MELTEEHIEYFRNHVMTFDAWHETILNELCNAALESKHLQSQLEGLEKLVGTQAEQIVSHENDKNQLHDALWTVYEHARLYMKLSENVERTSREALGYDNKTRFSETFAENMHNMSVKRLAEMEGDYDVSAGGFGPLPITEESANYVMVPAEPSEECLRSMAIRYDHGLAIPGYYEDHERRMEVTMRQMRQLYEEAVGMGFYDHPDPDA